MISLLLLSNFYPVISYRRVQKGKKATNYRIRLGRALQSAKQSPAQEFLSLLSVVGQLTYRIIEKDFNPSICSLSNEEQLYILYMRYIIGNIYIFKYVYVLFVSSLQTCNDTEQLVLSINIGCIHIGAIENLSNQESLKHSRLKEVCDKSSLNHSSCTFATRVMTSIWIF